MRSRAFTAFRSFRFVTLGARHVIATAAGRGVIEMTHVVRSSALFTARRARCLLDSFSSARQSIRNHTATPRPDVAGILNPALRRCAWGRAAARRPPATHPVAFGRRIRSATQRALWFQLNGRYRSSGMTLVDRNRLYSLRHGIEVNRWRSSSGITNCLSQDCSSSNFRAFSKIVPAMTPSPPQYLENNKRDTEEKDTVCLKVEACLRKSCLRSETEHSSDLSLVVNRYNRRFAVPVLNCDQAPALQLGQTSPLRRPADAVCLEHAIR
jgi:hypothetical protein